MLLNPIIFPFCWHAELPGVAANNCVEKDVVLNTSRGPLGPLLPYHKQNIEKVWGMRLLRRE